MGVNKEFASFIEEQLAPIGHFSASPFFGGRAYSCHGQQFAWIIDSTLYLRVTDATRADFEAHGATPFSYNTKKGEVTVRKFYTAPEFLLDDPAELLAWSRRAMGAAA